MVFFQKEHRVDFRFPTDWYNILVALHSRKKELAVKTQPMVEILKPLALFPQLTPQSATRTQQMIKDNILINYKNIIELILYFSNVLVASENCYEDTTDGYLIHPHNSNYLQISHEKQLCSST